MRNFIPNSTAEKDKIMIYKLAKTRYRRTLDQEDIVYITDERKHIITEPK